jgi:hypothetical protein
MTRNAPRGPVVMPGPRSTRFRLPSPASGALWLLDDGPHEGVGDGDSFRVGGGHGDGVGPQRRAGAGNGPIGGRVIPARVPGGEYLTHEPAGGPHRLRPPGKRHALPDRQPSVTAPALPRPPRPGKPAGQRADAGKCTLSSAANVKPHMGLRGPLSVARPCLRPPSVAVRAKPTVPRTAPWPRFPSAIRPWTPQYDGPQRYKVTHAGTKQKRPASARIHS